jgi:hypothetical protein
MLHKNYRQNRQTYAYSFTRILLKFMVRPHSVRFHASESNHAFHLSDRGDELVPGSQSYQLKISLHDFALLQVPI